jgi:hypothetical protein
LHDALGAQELTVDERITLHLDDVAALLRHGGTKAPHAGPGRRTLQKAAALKPEDLLFSASLQGVLCHRILLVR